MPKIKFDYYFEDFKNDLQCNAAENPEMYLQYIIYKKLGDLFESTDGIECNTSAVESKLDKIIDEIEKIKNQMGK